MAEKDIQRRRSERVGRARDVLTWDRATADKEVKRFKYQEIISNNDVMLEWLLCE